MRFMSGQKMSVLSKQAFSKACEAGEIVTILCGRDFLRNSKLSLPSAGAARLLVFAAPVVVRLVVFKTTLESG